MILKRSHQSAELTRLRAPQWTPQERPCQAQKAFDKAPARALARTLGALALLGFLTLLFLVPAEVTAGTGGVVLPWNTPFQNLLDNLTGTTARIFAGIMLVVAGIIWGFTRNEEGAKRFGQAVIAIALMFGAVQIVDALAFAGAVL